MPEQRARLSGVRQRLDAFLSGAPPSDPLYLTNRTWQQRLKSAALVASPVVLILLVMIAASTGLFRDHRTHPDEQPSAQSAPAAAPASVTPAPLEVTDLRIARDVRPPVVTGIFRNHTDRLVESAEISYSLTDNYGSVLATETTQVLQVGPHGTVTFSTPLKLSQADYVQFRDIRTN